MASKKIEGVKKGDLWITTPDRVRVVDGFNPRTVFIRAKLEELKASIRKYGIHTALLVRRDRTSEDQPFLLISGEYRLQSALELQAEGLDIKVPLRVLTVNEATAYEIAVSENLNRTDLSLRETANAVARLLNYGNTPAEVARKLGKPASWVTNMQHLLTLPTEVQELVDSGKVPLSTVVKLSQKVSPDRQTKVVKEALSSSNGNRARAAKKIETIAGYIRRPGKKAVRKDIAMVDRYRDVANGHPVTTEVAAKLISLALKYGVGQVDRDIFVNALAKHLPVSQ